MKKDILIDSNNLYVQGLIKVINDFMLEESSGCTNSELRLKNKIESLKSVFSEERGKMVIAGKPPVFAVPTADEYRLVFSS